MSVSSDAASCSLTDEPANTEMRRDDLGDVLILLLLVV